MNDYVGFNKDGHAVAIGFDKADILAEFGRDPRIVRIEKHSTEEAVRLHMAYLETRTEFRDLLSPSPARSRA
jgi:hypothetical protein